MGEREVWNQVQSFELEPTWEEKFDPELIDRAGHTKGSENEKSRALSGYTLARTVLLTSRQSFRISNPSEVLFRFESSLEVRETKSENHAPDFEICVAGVEKRKCGVNTTNFSW